MKKLSSIARPESANDGRGYGEVNEFVPVYGTHT